MSKERMHSISAAAAAAGLTAGTLREYERAGLLKPQRDSVGRRLYTTRDIHEARCIATKRAAARGRGLRKRKGRAVSDRVLVLVKQCCPDFEPQMKIIDGYIQTASARSGQDTFKNQVGKAFLYCPFCGTKRPVTP